MPGLAKTIQDGVKDGVLNKAAEAASSGGSAMGVLAMEGLQKVYKAITGDEAEKTKLIKEAVDAILITRFDVLRESAAIASGTALNVSDEKELQTKLSAKNYPKPGNVGVVGEAGKQLIRAMGQLGFWGNVKNSNATNARTLFVNWFTQICHHASTMDLGNAEGIDLIRYLDAVLLWGLGNEEIAKKPNFILEKVRSYDTNLQQIIGHARNHLKNALAAAIKDRNEKAGVVVMENLVNVCMNALCTQLPFFVLGEFTNTVVVGLDCNLLKVSDLLDTLLVATLQQVVKFHDEIDENTYKKHKAVIDKINLIIKLLDGNNGIKIISETQVILRTSAAHLADAKADIGTLTSNSEGELSTDKFIDKLTDLFDTLDDDGNIKITYTDDEGKEKELKMASGFSPEILATTVDVRKKIINDYIEILHLVNAVIKIEKAYRYFKKFAQHFGDQIYLFANEALNELIPASKATWQKLLNTITSLHKTVDAVGLIATGDSKRKGYMTAERHANFTMASEMLHAMSTSFTSFKASTDHMMELVKEWTAVGYEDLNTKYQKDVDVIESELRGLESTFKGLKVKFKSKTITHIATRRQAAPRPSVPPPLPPPLPGSSRAAFATATAPVHNIFSKEFTDSHYFTISYMADPNCKLYVPWTEAGWVGSMYHKDNPKKPVPPPLSAQFLLEPSSDEHGVFFKVTSQQYPDNRLYVCKDSIGGLVSRAHAKDNYADQDKIVFTPKDMKDETGKIVRCYLMGSRKFSDSKLSVNWHGKVRSYAYDDSKDEPVKTLGKEGFFILQPYTKPVAIDVSASGGLADVSNQTTRDSAQPNNQNSTARNSQ